MHCARVLWGNLRAEHTGVASRNAFFAHILGEQIGSSIISRAYALVIIRLAQSFGFLSGIFLAQSFGVLSGIFLAQSFGFLSGIFLSQSFGVLSGIFLSQIFGFLSGILLRQSFGFLSGTPLTQTFAFLSGILLAQTFAFLSDTPLTQTSAFLSGIILTRIFAPLRVNALGIISHTCIPTASFLTTPVLSWTLCKRARISVCTEPMHVLRAHRRPGQNIACV